MTRLVWLFLAAIVLGAAFVAPISALGAEAAFTVRHQENLKGDITLFGNTSMTCTTSTACTTAQGGRNSHNGQFGMQYVNVDPGGGRINSSSADLTLSANARVERAILYWTGMSTNAARTNVQIKYPGDATYTPVGNPAALLGDFSGNPGLYYAASVDITADVLAAGNGTYTVANIQSGQFTGYAAGWSIVVMYEDTNLPQRNLTIYDGFNFVRTTAAPTPITLSGFTTPPSGPVSAKVGIVALEGDLGIGGDRLNLEGTDLDDAVTPQGNFYNSGISVNGTRFSAKDPDYVNQLGFDAKIVDATGVIPNSATSATLTPSTTGDWYATFAATTSIENFAPDFDLSTSKNVIDVNGGEVEPGDQLLYTMTMENTGQDPADLSEITDSIPANTTFVPGSIAITAGPNTGSLSDSPGNDQGEISGGVVTVRLGTGADATDGGVIAPGQSTSVEFRVTVDSGVADGTVISNTAVFDFVGQTLGIRCESRSNSADVTVSNKPKLSGFKRDQLLIDVDGDGVAEPGDTLRYFVSVFNDGPATATGTTFTDVLDANTTLISGSVVAFPFTSTVTSGNGAGDTSVAVDLGAIAGTNPGPAGSATIIFDATINTPLDPSITQVCNQGQLSASNHPATLTDDLETGVVGDPTCSPLTAEPDVDATKTYSLDNDADSDGVPSPGDTLLYTVTITNNGGGNAPAVTFTDTPGANTSLVVGSVVPSQGVVAIGNTSGDTSVGVSLGTLLGGGGSAVITFRVVIDDPVPSGVSQVANQGSVSGSNITTLPTDDPTTGVDDDPTVTPISATAVVEADKTWLLTNDVNSDGLPGAGDTVTYSISLTNVGNQVATGVTLTDNPDASGALQNGTVVTDQGTVTTGNGVGDTGVVINVGSIVGSGGSVAISYDVVIDDPLAPESVSCKTRVLRPDRTSPLSRQMIQRRPPTMTPP